MKNIHLLIASVLCLGTTSCFDMNQEPQGEMSTVGAFTTTSEINMYVLSGQRACDGWRYGQQYCHQDAVQ